VRGQPFLRAVRYLRSPRLTLYKLIRRIQAVLWLITPTDALGLFLGHFCWFTGQSEEGSIPRKLWGTRDPRFSPLDGDTKKPLPGGESDRGFPFVVATVSEVTLSI